jgi:hypothetical protein
VPGGGVQVPNALRVARDTLARTALGPKSVDERIKETRASIAAAKASMEAQKRVEQVPRCPDVFPSLSTISTRLA